MKERNIGKGLAVAVILLFIGISMQPAVATVEPEIEIDIESKDYLFQTIIDIANNPEVKNLLDKYDTNLFSVDIDRGVYRKLFLRNPRLMFNTLFTKPSISMEYLNKCYNNGVEITNILGEDKVIETMENIEVTDTKLYDVLNDIISKDEELSNRCSMLKEMNKELDYEDFPVICSVLGAFIIFGIIIMFPFNVLFEILRATGIKMLDSIIYLLLSPLLVPLEIFFVSSAIIFLILNCLNLPEYD